MSALPTPFSDIEAQVVQRDGRVMLLFSRRVEGQLRRAETDNFVMDPQGAIDCAQLLTDMAFEADTALKPVGETLKSELVERHRRVLTKRLTHVLKTIRADKKKTDSEAAKDIIDICFLQIF